MVDLKFKYGLPFCKVEIVHRIPRRLYQDNKNTIFRNSIYKKVQGVFITHLPQTSLPTLFGQLPESSV